MANVAKLANTPVLLTKVPEHADEQWLFDAYARNLELSQAEDQPLYWVVDVRPAHSSYATSATGWMKIAQGLGGASVMPTLNVVFIAEPNMMPFFDKANLRAFTMPEEAFAFAANEVAVHAVSA